MTYGDEVVREMIRDEEVEALSASLDEAEAILQEKEEEIKVLVQIMRDLLVDPAGAWGAVVETVERYNEEGPRGP